jgi:uncharacterized membrane protein YqjE
MMEAAGEQTPGNGSTESALHPAREISLHLLRMLETRMEAAGIVVQAETDRVLSRLQLKLLAAAAMFIALWGGIVLLAIVLPPAWRVPVLSAVIVAFVLTAVWAVLTARRKIATTQPGSLAWFLDGLKLDLEVFSRNLAQAPAPPAAMPEQPGRPPSDIAA